MTSLPPVRLALVGLRFGAMLARSPAAKSHGLEVVSLCDRDPLRAARIAAEFGLPVAGWEETLADPGVDAVGLFTAPAGRAGMIGQAVRAGKDVLTTKPFELDAAAARQVLDEAARLGRVVHLNSPGPRRAADIAQIEAWRAARNLGRPVAMHAETWASYREQADGGWYDDPSLCGPAPLIRLGIYFLSEFAPLMGEAEAVQVFHSRLFTGRPTADNAQLCIRHRGGALSHVFASFCIDDGRPYPDAVTLHFEGGTIRRRVERDEGDFERRRAFLELSVPGEPLPLRAETPPGEWCGWYQWEAFREAVRSRTPLPADRAARIVDGIRLLEAVSRSYASGREEAV